MKYLTWFTDYSDGTGAAYSFDTLDKAINYAKQYSPFSDVFIRNKIYIQDDETGKILIPSKQLKSIIRKHHSPN